MRICPHTIGVRTHGRMEYICFIGETVRCPACLERRNKIPLLRQLVRINERPKRINEFPCCSDNGSLRLSVRSAKDGKTHARDILCCSLWRKRIDIRKCGSNIFFGIGEELLDPLPLAIEEVPLHHERHLPARERRSGV